MKINPFILLCCLLGTTLAWAEDPQPIAFSHQLHATQNEIPCQFCHIYARRSYVSGVPPMQVCVGCHGTEQMKLIAPQSAEVDKMRDYWAKGEPIPWVKIHDVPDFVRFPHKRHINAKSERFRDGAGNGCDLEKDPRSNECRVHLFQEGGDTRCQACHGDVSSMEVVQKVDDNFGDMGWCLECHLEVKGVDERKRASSTLSGWFNAKEENETRAGQIEWTSPTGDHHAHLTDCLTCHY